MPGSGHEPRARVGPQPLHELRVDDRHRLVVLAPDHAERKRELAQRVAQVAGERGIEGVTELAGERRAAESMRVVNGSSSPGRASIFMKTILRIQACAASMFSQGRGWRSARRMTGRRT